MVKWLMPCLAKCPTLVHCTHFGKGNDAALAEAPVFAVIVKVICKCGMRVAVTVMFSGGSWAPKLLLCGLFSDTLHILTFSETLLLPLGWVWVIIR